MRPTRPSPTTPPSSSPPAAADRPPRSSWCWSPAPRPTPLDARPSEKPGGGAAAGGRPGGLPTRTLFVLGAPTAPSEQPALRAEAERHGDLLQGAFADTYANLTRKTAFLLRWATSRCPAAPFILKADDDVFVNLPALTNYLASFRRAPPRLYLGRIHWWVRPQRDPRGRHHVPAAVYPAATFPLYCSGTAYVLSGEAAAAVLAAAPRVPFVAPEDVWVGLCAQRAGLAPRHSARMAGSARFPLDGCCYGEVLFSSHGLGPGELRRVWGLLQGEGGGL